MRKSFRWLLGSALGIVASVALAGEGGNTLFVGQHKLTDGELKAKIKSLGKVLGRNADGYFRVAPLEKKSLKSLEQELEKRFDIVLPGDADDIRRTNLFSVEHHIEYKKGIYKIRTGKEPKEGDAEELGVDFYEALEWYLKVRVDPKTGELDQDAYRRAAAHRDAMPPATADMLDPYRDKSAAPVAWALVGPKRLATPYQIYYGSTGLSGRKNMVAPAPSSPTTAYIASAGGGVWKTTDNYVTFSPLSDNWQFMHTMCVEVHPTDPNTVYVGTGDAYGFFTRQTFGIMKSTDGGSTWTNLGNADFGDSVVTRIEIDPSNTNNVIALVSGPSGDIWRSTDAGATWARTNAPDVSWQDIDRTTSGFWIAVTGDGDHIYFAPSDGGTWTALTNPTGSGGGRWDVACSRVDSGRAYMVQSNGKVFRTTDNYISWTDITAAHDAGVSDPSYNKSQITYDMYIDTGFSGSNDIVYTGLITINASDDNGATWTDCSRSFESNSKWHNDQHNGRMYPGQGTWQFAVGDGGLTFFTYDTGTNAGTFTDLNSTFCDTQFYHIAVHPTDSLRATGGTQDNASPMQRGAATGSTTMWFNAFAGDGAGTGFDVASPGTHYSSSQGGNFYRYDSDSDTTATGIGFGGGPFITPLVMGGATRSNPTAISGTSVRKWSSGTTWTSHPTGGGTLQSLNGGRSSGDELYTGASNGDVYRTEDYAATFTRLDDLSGTDLPNRPIGGSAESFFTNNWIITGLQGAGFSDGVWRLPSGGTSWLNVSGSGLTALPAMPVNDVERDPTNVTTYFAATDVGVFMSPNEGTTWYNMNAMGLPNVHVNDLWVYSNGGATFLYAGTFGRGIWRCLLSARSLTSLLVAKPQIWGGQQNTLTVKMNGSAPVGSVATLSDSSSSVSIPTSVTFPQGSTQVGFTAFTVNPAATETVTVSASCWGTSVSNSFTLHHIPAFTYTPESANIYGGNRFNATINMGAPNPITAVYTFSDNAVQVASPSSTSIAAGAQTRTVALYTAAVASTVNALISAKLANTTATGSVALQPRPDLSNLTLSTNSIVGGNNLTGTITLTAAGAAGPQTVTTSDTSSIVGTPSSVVVPGGSATQNFNITTNVVGASYNVTVKARLRTITKTQVLNVHP